MKYLVLLLLFAFTTPVFADTFSSSGFGDSSLNSECWSAVEAPDPEPGGYDFSNLHSGDSLYLNSETVDVYVWWNIDDYWRLADGALWYGTNVNDDPTGVSWIQNTGTAPAGSFTFRDDTSSCGEEELPIATSSLATTTLDTINDTVAMAFAFFFTFFGILFWGFMFNKIKIK